MPIPVAAMNAAEIAKALDARELTTGGWSAKCPAHEDKNPSLSIAEGTKGPVVRCHAGCEQSAVIDALRGRGLWPKVNGEIPLAHAQLGRYSQHWDYQNAAGEHVIRVCRWDRENGKEIRPLTHQGERWTWKHLEENRPLYRLPALVTDKTRRVLVVEGEKTADAAQKYFPDIAVTTWCGGSKAAGKTDWKPLAGRDVTLFADNDEPGRKAMDAVAAILQTHGCTIRRVDLSQLGAIPEGWDVADTLEDKSFDLDALWSAVMDAPKVSQQLPSELVPPVSVVAPSKSMIRIRRAAEVAAELPRSTWLLRPYIERNAIAILYGDFGTYKSFVAIDWAMRIALGLPALGFTWASPKADVLLISAEGRGLAQRLRGWCIRHRPGEPRAEVLARAPLYCIEHPVNLSDPSSALALVECVNGLGITPGFIIIDTMTRNSDGRIENSTTDAAAYLGIIDQGLRARYGCAVLLTHHVGHVEKGRIRGPIVLAANTDALIRIERPDPEQRVATLSVDRLKDSDMPAAQGLRADIIELGELDEDGQPITTLALSAAGAITTARPKPSGKQQTKLLAELEKRHTAGERVWTELDLRRIARELDMHRNSARDAVVGLVSGGYLQDSVGGRVLRYPPEECTK